MTMGDAIEVDVRSLFDFGEGDVTVAATWKEQQVQFSASSHAMSFASPVGKKMVADHLARLSEEEEDGERSQTADDEENIKQEDDNDASSDDDDDGEDRRVLALNLLNRDGEALLLLLRIAHL